MGNDPKGVNNLDPFRDSSAHTEVGGQGRQQPQQPRQPRQPEQPRQPQQPRHQEQPQQPRQPEQPEQPDDQRPYYRPMNPEDVRLLHELQQMQPLPQSLHPLQFSLLLLQRDSPEEPYCDAQREFIRNIPNWAW